MDFFNVRRGKAMRTTNSRQFQLNWIENCNDICSRRWLMENITQNMPFAYSFNLKISLKGLTFRQGSWLSLRNSESGVREKKETALGYCKEEEDDQCPAGKAGCGKRPGLYLTYVKGMCQPRGLRSKTQTTRGYFWTSKTARGVFLLGRRQICWRVGLWPL